MSYSDQHSFISYLWYTGNSVILYSLGLQTLSHLELGQ